MRLWSIHPSYLDAKGLVALWREALLAQQVLRGLTRGYRHHPQLDRFRKSGCPVTAVSAYLWAVHAEATARGYAFDASKIAGKAKSLSIPVTEGQLALEWEHLKAKLRQRDPQRYRQTRQIQEVSPHPLFTVVPGEIEPWERNERAASKRG